MIEAVLFAATQVSTFLGSGALTHASGFFFRRDERLFLVTSRHVLIDEPTGHLPDRIEIEQHPLLAVALADQGRLQRDRERRFDGATLYELRVEQVRRQPQGAAWLADRQHARQRLRG